MDHLSAYMKSIPACRSRRSADRRFRRPASRRRVDELCLTVAPVLAGGDAGRIAVGQRRPALGALQLVGVVEADVSLPLRYA